MYKIASTFGRLYTSVLAELNNSRSILATILTFFGHMTLADNLEVSSFIKRKPEKKSVKGDHESGGLKQ